MMLRLARGLVVLAAVAAVWCLATATSQDATSVISTWKNEQVSVQFRWPNGDFVEQIHLCGASILNHRWLLTAAHCIDHLPELLELGEDGEMMAILGAHGLYERGPHQQEVAIAHMYQHDSYNNSRFNNDIMLLYLQEDIVFSDHVSPICLSKNDVEPGTYCYATGRGLMYVTPDYLRQVRLPVLTRETCAEFWHGAIDEESPFNENMFCGAYEEGYRSVCNGDSGGPYVCYGNGHWEQYGISSRVYTNCGLIDLSPSVFTRITNYVDWIERIMEDHTE